MSNPSGTISGKIIVIHCYSLNFKIKDILWLADIVSTYDHIPSHRRFLKRVDLERKIR